MWPPALVTPARDQKQGPRTSRLNHSLDFRHGVWTRYGRRKRQCSTAVSRRGSEDEDARNRERKATKATERTMKKEAEVSTETTGVTKGGDVPSMLKPRGDQVAQTHDLRGSQSAPTVPQVGGRTLSGLQSCHTATWRSSLPNCPASRATGTAVQPVLDSFETPHTLGTDTIDIRNSMATSTVWDSDARPRLDFTLTDLYLSPSANYNVSWGLVHTWLNSERAECPYCEHAASWCWWQELESPLSWPLALLLRGHPRSLPSASWAAHWAHVAKPHDLALCSIISTSQLLLEYLAYPEGSPGRKQGSNDSAAKATRSESLMSGERKRIANCSRIIWSSILNTG